MAVLGLLISMKSGGLVLFTNGRKSVPIGKRIRRLH